MASLDRFYSAFISYKHLDVSQPGRNWAEWVKSNITEFKTPPDLIGQTGIYEDAVPSSMPNIFLDKEQLPGMGDLGSMLNAALERSRVLIVLCSPKAATSDYVRDEVTYFKKLGRANRIIPIVLEGKPYSTDPAQECYPPALAYELNEDGTPDPSRRANPIFIDLRPTDIKGTPSETMGMTNAAAYRELLEKENVYKETAIETLTSAYADQLSNARIMLISGALGLYTAELTQRERLRIAEEAREREEETVLREKEAAQRERAARRRLQLALAAATVFLALAAATGWFFVEARKNATEAQVARNTAEQNARLAKEGEARAKEAEEKANAAKEDARTALAKAEENATKATAEAGRAKRAEDAANAAREKLETSQKRFITIVSGVQGLSGWGSSLPDSAAEALSNFLCDSLASNPPDSSDATLQAIYSSALNRRGDIQMGDVNISADKMDAAAQQKRLLAEASYKKAEEMARAVLTLGSNQFSHHALGGTLDRRAKVEQVKGNDETLPVEDRRAHYEEALKIWTVALGEFHTALTFTQSPDFRIAEPIMRCWIGSANSALGKLEPLASPKRAEYLKKSQESFSESLKGLKAVLQVCENDPAWQASVPTWQNDVRNVTGFLEDTTKLLQETTTGSAAEQAAQTGS